MFAWHVPHERHRAPGASCSSPRGLATITSCLMTFAAAPAVNMFASVLAQPTAEESAAAAWLGRSVHGYCAETSDQGDCKTGLKGTWSLTPHEVRHGWLGAAVACLARCRRCQRCHTVSLAVRFTDCSWFAADTGCNTSELQQKPSGFRSAPLSAATPSRNSSTPASFRDVGQRSAELRSDEFDVLDRLQYGPAGEGLGPREGCRAWGERSPQPETSPSPDANPNQVRNAGSRRRARCRSRCHE